MRGRAGARVGMRVNRARKQPGPETSMWYWNPRHPAVRLGPADFRSKLQALDRDLEITWSPVHEAWGIWTRKDRVNTPNCQGWLLLFTVPPRALDERVFARLYAASADKWGSGKEYFYAVRREIERAEEKKKAATLADTLDRAMPFFEHSKIKVSMCGPSSGSKFADYHS